MSRVGRPSEFTQEIADAICDLLASGSTLRKIVKAQGMPVRETVRQWRMRYPEFAAQYAQARIDQAENYFDEIIEIGESTINVPTEVQGAKLRCDNLKWVLARMDRSKYGEHSRLDLGGQEDNPLKTEQAIDLSTLSPEMREQAMKLAHALIMAGEAKSGGG